MKNLVTLSAVFASLLLATACTTTDGASTMKTVQIAGHPWKSDANCVRKAPVGKFDSKCDHPVLGYKNFSDPTINVGSGGVGGLGL